MNMLDTIVPKSDQLNADDLIGRNLTITVTKVAMDAKSEQPVSLHFDGDGGKPYKACKSMRRVLVQLWGPDAKVYEGRSMTLYRDPTVLWAGQQVGGIRISHMSHIDKAITMALTATKKTRAPFTVKPLVVEKAPDPTTSARPKFSAWLASYADVMKQAPDLAALSVFINADETAVKVRIEGSDAQKAALAKAEDDARGALQTGFDTLPGEVA